MRVLWVGDAGCSTGFARCTDAACGELHRGGWEVHVLGINYRGDPHEYPYKMYPCIQPFDEGRDVFGVTRLPVLASRLKPDVIVLLNDPWNVPQYLDYYARFVDGVRERGAKELADRMAAVPFVGWLAVDAQNQDGSPLDALDHVAVWTSFAAEELKRGGYSGEPSVVPLGVDHDLFYPRDRAQSRRVVCPPDLPADAFVVGAVGRNQPRKRLDLTVRYFARFVHDYRATDAYLYLHVAPTNDRECDVERLCKYYDVPKGRVVVARPSIGFGAPEETMPLVYSALDVLVTTTQGEGWGLPVLEAMACGTPCVVPDWSALGEWPGDAVVKIPCSSVALNAPLNGRAYTVGGVPDEEDFVCALRDLYRDSQRRSMLSERGIARASDLSWRRTGREFREVLESVVETCGTVEEATA